MFLAKKQPSRRRDAGPLKNPEILEVNLVKNEAPESFAWRSPLISLVLVLVLAAVVIFEIYYGLSWWQRQEEARGAKTQAEIAQLNRESSQLANEAAEALAYQGRAATFGRLLQDHVYWTNFFAWLERNTLTTVRYEGFAGGLDGNYELSAVTQTYADVAWQVSHLLKDPAVRSAAVSSAQMAVNDDKSKPSEVTFNLSLSIKPEIFRK